jgi:hypothetical protein
VQPCDQRQEQQPAELLVGQVDVDGIVLRATAQRSR